MSNVRARVLLESPSTIIQLREGDRSVAQIKLANSDHLRVIEGLLEAVLPHDDQARAEIMDVISARANKKFL